MKKILAWFLLLTWGAIMSFIGLVAALILRLKGYKPTNYKGAMLFEVGYGWGGITLGFVIIVCKDNYESLRAHEFGHVIQNMIFGPLFVVLVAIPSLIRSQYRTYVVNKGIKQYYELPDYDAAWFE